MKQQEYEFFWGHSCQPKNVKFASGRSWNNVRNSPFYQVKSFKGLDEALRQSHMRQHHMREKTSWLASECPSVSLEVLEEVAVKMKYWESLLRLLSIIWTWINSTNCKDARRFIFYPISMCYLMVFLSDFTHCRLWLFILNWETSILAHPMPVGFEINTT